MIRVALLCLIPAIALASPIKIATWNLNWLTTRSQTQADLPADVQPRTTTDFAALHRYAEKLAADIIAFQEVDGPATAALVFDPAQYTVLTINENIVQQVGIAVRHNISITRNPDLTALNVEPNAKHQLRNGLDVTLTFPNRSTLRVLVIHLKTGCQTDRIETSRRPQCALLAQQIPILAQWIATRRADEIAFAVIGDFNRVMDNPESMSSALQNAAKLTQTTAGKSDPCWEPGSFIDHILLGGAASSWLIPGSLRVLTYAETDPAMKAHLSDHCPVSVRLQP
jgi:endonuclease/exonuclease/phosphatase family metal-dependent hydrolase